MGAFRLFLALVVALGHWQFGILSPRGLALPGGIWLGFNLYYAVLFFYVISGFLITYTLARNYEPSAAGVRRFYTKRAVRIFSLYWPLCVVALLVLPEARHAMLNGTVIDRFTSIFLFGADWRWSFGQPGGQYVAATLPGIPQAWSLGAELTFYLMAPFLMRSWRIAVALLVGSFVVRMALVVAFGPRVHDLWTYTFFPSTLVFFLLGHLAAKASERWSALASPKIGLALTSAGLLAMALLPVDSVDVLNFPARFDSVRFWLSIMLFAAGLPGFFNATKHSRIMNQMGDLSYPVYLVHVLAIVFFGALPLEMATMAFAIPIFIVGMIAAAIAARFLLEIPVARAMSWVVTCHDRPHLLHLRHLTAEPRARRRERS